MKYTLQIAFSKPVGDILLRVCEYAKKFGSSSADYINPLLFDFSDNNSIKVQRPEKKCPVADLAVLAAELHFGVPLGWITDNSSQTLNDGSEIEDFFEREFSDKILEENNVDPEMHIVFYVPLYEEGIYKHVEYIIDNLPKGHKFVANVIGITYDMAWACRMLEKKSKEVYAPIMLRNINALANLTKLKEGNFNTVLKHIFLFQNYNVSGWSLDFTTKKFIEVCANLSLCLVEHYDTICRTSWEDYAWEDAKEQKNRPIYAINLRSRVIDLYLGINYLFRNLFSGVANDNIIDEETIDKEKVKKVYTEVLEHEIELIRDFKDHFISGLEEQEAYDNYFNDNIKEQFKNYILDSIDKHELNVSEQQYLYSLFSQITENTDFESPAFDESTWELEEMILLELNIGEDTDLMDTFRKLKGCSKEITDVKNSIEEEEAIIEDLKGKLDETEEFQGEFTEEGYKIGEEVFKPYHIQDEPLDVKYEIPEGQTLPTSVDLRKDFSEIRNQGGQGACTAFSLVSVMEYYLHKALNRQDALSESFAYYNARALRNETEVDEGATLNNIIKGAMDYGICLRDLCPYDEHIFNQKPSDDAYSDAEKRKITEAKDVDVTVDDIKSALAQGFPVVVSAMAFKEYVVNHDGVITPPTDLGDSDSGHAVVICGYSDIEGYFLIRNSWGTGRGKGINGSGYYLLPYECVRKPGLIRRAYAVTGLNIEGFDKGDLPELGSILNGRTINAQYAIYQNMLREKNLHLDEDRKRLAELQKEYLALFNEIADYSNVELTLEELKKANDEERAQLEEELKQIAQNVPLEVIEKKGRLALFGKSIKNFINRKKEDEEEPTIDPNEDRRKEIEERLAKLDHNGDDVKREYRVKIALLNGLRAVNDELLQESVRRSQLSEYYIDENNRINKYNNADEEQYAILKKILPLDDILSKLSLSGIGNLFSAFGSTMSKVARGEIGLYESLGDIHTQIMNQIANEFDIHISEYLLDGTYESFYDEIRRSVVMAQLYGGVPTGYGDETKYFFCNIEAMPKRVNQENAGFMFLPIKDNLRMCFLQMEKYNVEDMQMFKEEIDKQEKENNAESVLME